MCLLATTAEIKLKRKIVTFQAGRSPGVPILAASGPPERAAHRRLGVACGSGEETPTEELAEQFFPQQIHQLVNKLLRHVLLQSRMMHEGRLK